MYNTNKSLYDRALEKTLEQLFINSLRKEYELSPAESSGILELAKNCLKGIIVELYEQGHPEIDIARLTNHSIEAVGRYIKSYKNIKLLMEKKFNLIDMVRISGMGRSTVIQYRELVELYHPELKYESKK